jgi:hypothetical protein
MRSPSGAPKCVARRYALHDGEMVDARMARHAPELRRAAPGGDGNGQRAAETPNA